MAKTSNVKNPGFEYSGSLAILACLMFNSRWSTQDFRKWTSESEIFGAIVCWSIGNTWQVF